MSDVSKLILAYLIKDDEFTRKVLPNVKREYFKSGEPDRVVFELVEDYVKKYAALPSPEAMIVELQARRDLSEDLFSKSAELLEAAVTDESDVQRSWLLEQAEKWCRDRAIHNALKASLQILNDEGEKGLSESSIPKLFQDAISVTFDPSIGHDYFENSATRFAEYHSTVSRLPFDLASFNDITKGGLLNKTLNVVMAVSGAGKSLFMCHCAAHHLMLGKNVLYLTLELSEQMVASRIDANLMGVDINALRNVSQSVLKAKIESIRSKTPGRLVVKEYSQAGSAHFRHVIDDLRVKKNFVPDIIYVDYLNICVPTSRKGDMNSYDRVKLIAEELRAIAVDYNLPLVTATQSNRTAYGSSTVGMESVSDSIGLPMTADFMFALIQTEELNKIGQYKVVQLKSRYDDIGRRPVFFLGVEKPTMRLYDVDPSFTSPDDAAGQFDAPDEAVFGGRLNFSNFS